MNKPLTKSHISELEEIIESDEVVFIEETPSKWKRFFMAEPKEGPDPFHMYFFVSCLSAALGFVPLVASAWNMMGMWSFALCASMVTTAGFIAWGVHSWSDMKQQWSEAKSNTRKSWVINSLTAACVGVPLFFGVNIGVAAGMYFPLQPLMGNMEQSLETYKVFQSQQNQLNMVGDSPNPKFFDEDGFLRDNVKEEYCELSNKDNDLQNQLTVSSLSSSGTLGGINALLSNSLNNNQYIKGCLSLSQLEEKRLAVQTAWQSNPPVFDQFINKWSYIPFASYVLSQQPGIDKMIVLNERSACELAANKTVAEKKMHNSEWMSVCEDLPSDQQVSFDKIEYYNFKFQSGASS